MPRLNKSKRSIHFAIQYRRRNDVWKASRDLAIWLVGYEMTNAEAAAVRRMIWSTNISGLEAVRVCKTLADARLVMCALRRNYPHAFKVTQVATIETVVAEVKGRKVNNDE